MYPRCHFPFHGNNTVTVSHSNASYQCPGASTQPVGRFSPGAPVIWVSGGLPQEAPPAVKRAGNLFVKLLLCVTGVKVAFLADWHAAARTSLSPWSAMVVCPLRAPFGIAWVVPSGVADDGMVICAVQSVGRPGPTSPGTSRTARRRRLEEGCTGPIMVHQGTIRSSTGSRQVAGRLVGAHRRELGL